MNSLNLDSRGGEKGQKYLNQLVLNSEKCDFSTESQEKWFPYHIYKKDKLIERAIKIKTLDHKYSQLFLGKTL